MFFKQPYHIDAVADAVADADAVQTLFKLLK